MTVASRIVRGLVLLVIAAAMPRAGAATASRGSTTLVSVSIVGDLAASGDSYGATVSRSGRFVAFSSAAADLVAGDTNGRRDVFVRDLPKRNTTLVSANVAGTGGGNGDSSTGVRPAISGNGRFVAFCSEASDLVSGDTNGLMDVFVRDLKEGVTIPVSVDASGDLRGADSFPPYGGVSISDNGRFVVFGSRSDDLVPGDANGALDVFIRDLRRGTTALVSVSADGATSANGRSSSPSVSRNGRFVAFDSSATDLVPEATGGVSNVYRRDMRKGTTVLVSVNAASTAAGEALSASPTISPNGRFVAFASRASDLVYGDTNYTYDVFLRDVDWGTTTLVSVNMWGTGSGNGSSAGAVLSAHGRIVAFDSEATDLSAGDVNGRRLDVFARDLWRGVTTLVSVNLTNMESGDFGSGFPAISGNGRHVAFDSAAGDLHPADGNAWLDVFVRSSRATRGRR